MADGAGAPNERDLAYFQRWKVDSLKEYLRKRGVGVGGTKEELAAKCYAAYEMKIPLLPSAQSVREDKATDYERLLTDEFGERLPDPLSELEGWLGEKDGIKKWPPTMYWDICQFMGFSSTGELTERLMKDYKDCKGYSYYTSGWIKEIMYHPINAESKKCFVKANCTPSMNVNNNSHVVWVCVHKESGTIQSAYCTCFAGLGETCNHIAALLFRMDAAWKSGATQPSCTDVACEWKKPATTKELLQPSKIKDMNWEKPRINKSGKDSVTVRLAKRSLYDPNSNHEADIGKLLEVLRIDSPSSVIHTVWPTPSATHLSSRPQAVLPQSITELAKNSSSPKELLNKIQPIMPETAGLIERETVGQSKNPIWKKQRNGRITASIFHEVYTKVNTIQSKGTENVNVEPLLSKVLGYSASIYYLPSIKYGMQTEKLAKQAFSREILKQHEAVVIEECGLYVCPNYPFIGASPDLIMSCNCCGISTVEIKCPLSSAFAVPQAGSPDYLEEVNGQTRLKKKHNYYTQIQGQMGVTNISRCFFFVYSKHGFVLETITFDFEFWNKVLRNLKFFFESVMVEELVTQSLYKKLEATRESQSDLSVTVRSKAIQHTGNPSQQPSTSQVKMGESSSQIVGKKSGNKAARGRKRKSGKPVYLCGKCQNACKDEADMDTEADSSVCCDKCHRWYHLSCVGLTQTSDVLQADMWFCDICAKN